MSSFELLGMGWQAWFVILLIATMFGFLIKSKIPPDIIFLGSTLVLLLAGIVTPEVALSGFSNSTTVVIGLLFTITAALEATGVLSWLARHLLGKPRGTKTAIARLMFPAAVLSGLVTNVTIVAMFTNLVKKWAKDLKIPASKLLIPLSYASCLGGTLTIIGSTPNLFISEIMKDSTGLQIGFFSITLAGLFVTVVGVLAVMLMSKWLPLRQTPEEQMQASEMAVTELGVSRFSHLVGMTIEEAGITDLLKNGRLIGIIRFDKEVVSPVDKDEFLMGGDHLVISAEPDEITKLANLGLTVSGAHETKTSFRTILSATLMIAMVVLTALKVLPLITACALTAMLMLITRCVDLKKARAETRWEVLMVMAGSIVLGKAVSSTGIATAIGSAIAGINGISPFIALALICLVGTFMTEFISNLACCAVLAPIAFNIAAALGANPMTFAIGLIIAVSSSFATPIGTPAHMIVYMAGGYKFTDFSRMGLPMNFIILAANLFIVPLLFPF